MIPKYLRPEDIPRLREEDGPKQQIKMLQDYLYKLQEQLRYILDNLTEDNWNEAALQLFLGKLASASDVQQLAQTVQELSDKVEELAAQIGEANV